MQILKDEVRENIRLAAVAEFKLKGYSSACMRTIADSAGISVGNLYRYFRNKECLLDFIVAPIHAHVTAEIKLEHKMYFLDVNLLEHLEFIKSIAMSQSIYKDELYILLEKSKGSKYEDTKRSVIERLQVLFAENIISEVNREKDIVKGNIFVKAFAASLMEGVSSILIESEDDDFIQNILQYLEFTFKSTVRTMIAMRDGKMNFRRMSDEEIINCISNSSCD